MKLNVVTLSDKNYLSKGLALYESLIETNSEFTLHYLCLDSESYSKLKDLSLENIRVYSADELISKDSTLESLKVSNYWYFCMTCASYFMNHLFELGFQEITYADSDILFYRSVNELIESFGEDSQIAIFRHRQFPMGIPRWQGWFNVGVMHFKNEKFGRKVLRWWSDCVLNRKHPELSTCGDQKYLDKFPEMCPSEFIFIDDGVGHGAPWHWQTLDLSDIHENLTVGFEGNKQKYFFTHFSQFSYDLKKMEYTASTQHHEYLPLSEYNSNPNLKKIYDDYFRKIIAVNNKYRIQ